ALVKPELRSVHWFLDRLLRHSTGPAPRTGVLSGDGPAEASAFPDVLQEPAFVAQPREPVVSVHSIQTSGGIPQSARRVRQGPWSWRCYTHRCWRAGSGGD